MEPDWIEFPRVADSLLRRHRVRRARLVPLSGSGALLDLNFAEQERPVLVTRIIEAGSRGADAAPLPERFVWEMPISARIAALLRLAASEDVQPTPIVFRCGECSTQLAMHLRLGQIASLHEGRPSSVRVRLSGGAARLRIPTGADQREMMAGASELDLVCRLVLRSSAEPAVADLAVIDKAFSTHDPLVDYRCEAICCECGARATHAVNLQETALEALRRLQREMLADVHMLASCYHWPESQIREIPRWRRAWYLERLSRGRW